MVAYNMSLILSLDCISDGRNKLGGFGYFLFILGDFST